MVPKQLEIMLKHGEPAIGLAQEKIAIKIIEINLLIPRFRCRPESSAHVNRGAHAAFSSAPAQGGILELSVKAEDRGAEPRLSTR